MTIDEIINLMEAASKLDIEEFSVGDLKVRFERQYAKDAFQMHPYPMPAAKVSQMVPEEPEQTLGSAPSRVEVGVGGNETSDYKGDSLLELALNPESDLFVPPSDNEKA